MNCVLVLIASVLSTTNVAMELDSLGTSGNDLYNKLVDIHTKVAQWNADGEIYGQKEKPLSSYDQYRSFDTCATEILREQEISTVGALALFIASKKDAHNDIKRTMADYLFDHGGFGSRLHVYTPQSAFPTETSHLRNFIQETSEEDMVTLDLENESETPNSLFTKADDKKLYTFVSNHCTSISYIERNYPDLIEACDDTFSVKSAGIRSLQGLSEVAESRCRKGISDTRDQIAEVCFKDNYLQRLYRQEIADVFTKVKRFKYTNNPLHFVDLAGAQQGDTFYIESTCPDGKLVLNMHSLRSINPVNIYVKQSSVSLAHQNEIGQLLKQMNSKGKLKRYVALVSIGLAYVAGSVLLSECIVESTFLAFAGMITGTPRLEGYSFGQVYDGITHSDAATLMRILMSLAASGIMLPLYACTQYNPTIDESVVSRYRSHNLVFK